MNSLTILNAKEYHKKMKEIDSLKIENKRVISQIVLIYLKNEYIIEKPNGWKGCTAYYRGGDDFIFLPKITVSYVVKKDLEKDEIGLYDKNEFCTKEELEAEDFRFARLKNIILSKRKEDVLDGYKRSLKYQYAPKKQETREILDSKEEMFDYLKKNFFEELNNRLKKLKLPQLDCTQVEHHESHTQKEDNKDFHYLEMVTFNIEGWSTHKLCLFKNGGINSGRHDIEKTWPIENFILDIIEETKEWNSAMTDNQRLQELEREPTFIEKI